MRTRLTPFVAALALLLSMAALATNNAEAATTLIVDDTFACPGATYNSIQAAVNAASPGDTVQVCAGTYAENVTISTPNITLNGAQAGQPVSGRVFGSPTESTLTGQITIQAAGVTVDGFSQTNPGQAFGIVVKTAGSGAAIQNNIIDTVGGATFAGGGGAQGIYLENGPDNVSIVGNAIRNIQSIRSAKGILIGDTASSNSALNILIEGNTIEDITSTTRGAYGIQVNNGAPNSSRPTNIASTIVVIRNNIIDDLTGGGWAHAIGLEGDTPGAVITGNCISDIIDTTPTIPEDAIAVFFESNPSFASAEVHQNNFVNVSYGIAVHPALTGGSVDGENNWWGSADGPGPVGPGSGAKVSPNVDYSPWLLGPAVGGACGGVEATSQDQCKNGGWQTLFRANGSSFKNQGDCIQYVNTGK